MRAVRLEELCLPDGGEEAIKASELLVPETSTS